MARKSDATEAEEAVEGAEVKETKSKKAPKPDGYCSPVEFAKVYAADKAGVAVEDLTEDQIIRPQIIYGYIKNNKEFADGAVEANVDGKLMVNIAQGLAILNARDAKRAQTAAEKAAKETEEVSEETYFEE